MKLEQIESFDWSKGDGLLPAVVQDASNGKVLMLGYMNREALRKTLGEKRVTFYSRSKQRLWTKGETSSNFLHLVDAAIDCDNDTLLITARPDGPTCHNGTDSCFGDDIGTTNVSAYSDGLMGYETPHIDRIAAEGLRFLHYYGEQSCTAGRAAFLTGQHGIRTGMTKVGFPGAPMGMSQLDPSIGGLLKNLGYTTGQFGKNHVGDRNETLPTVNGFDEFFGNLYHLNAEEEPELPDYPKDPEYRKRFGPRGVG